MNRCREFFENYPNKLQVDKWIHYLDIYDRHFKKFVGKKPRILEIGVQKGGSLEMWNYYFNGECEIFGIDIEEQCREIPEKLQATNISVEIGDQADRLFWINFLKDKEKFDIVIDDGGHTMVQQIVTFNEIYNHISEDGVFLCEDLHTSYLPQWGGGLRKQGTFIEFSKNFVDLIHADHYGIDRSFKAITNSIHYYDSVIVLEKKKNPDRPLREIKRGSMN